MHQALNTIAEVDEGAKGDKLGDGTLDDSADRVLLDERAPRILGGLLETEGDTLAVEVDVENLNLDLLADLDDLGGMVDMVPGELGDVDQAVDATEVDECAEVRASSSTTRRERTTLLRLRSISMTRASMRVPM